jgi:hypothetical protein
MTKTLYGLIAITTIVAPGLHLLSDILEWVNGRFSQVQLLINYIGWNACKTGNPTLNARLINLCDRLVPALAANGTRVAIAFTRNHVLPARAKRSGQPYWEVVLE